MSSRQFSVRCLQGPHFYSVFSPPWRVQPGETPLQDCPAPGRRGAYNPAKRHSKIAQRRAGGPRTTRRNATPRLPSAGPEALRPHPPPRRAELIFKSPCDRSTSRSGRRSSVVEQLIRNQQVAGSNPIAGSKNIKWLQVIAYSIFCLVCIWCAQILGEVTSRCLNHRPKCEFRNIVKREHVLHFAPSYSISRHFHFENDSKGLSQAGGVQGPFGIGHVILVMAVTRANFPDSFQKWP